MRLLILMLAVLTVAACGARQTTLPPQHAASDSVDWLENPEDPRTAQFVERESAYFASSTLRSDSLQRRLLREFRGSDSSPPEEPALILGDYRYWSRSLPGQPFPLYLRQKQDGPEETVLDFNLALHETPGARLVALRISPDHQNIAYAVQENTWAPVQLFVRNVTTGASELVAQHVHEFEFAADGWTVLYTVYDDSQRPAALYAQNVLLHYGGESGERLLYTESDPAFFLGLSRAKSGEYLFLSSQSLASSEVLAISALSPFDAPQPFAPRAPGVRYTVTHAANSFFIQSNRNSSDFKLTRRYLSGTSKSPEAVVFSPSADTTLEDLDGFDKFLVLSVRVNGRPELWVKQVDAAGYKKISFESPVYSLKLTSNLDYNATGFEFIYSSPVTPPQRYSYDLGAAKQRLVSQQVTSSNDRYRCEQHTVVGDLKISQCYNTAFSSLASAPALLYGYGAYGLAADLSFQPELLTLLDRGISYAVCHVRGGGERGQSWYQAALPPHRQNSIDDFKACARYLATSQLAAPDKIIAMGRSAGGMLAASAALQSPNLFRAVVLDSAFLDVIRSMRDPNLPLATRERREWGDPSVPAQLSAMQKYSPLEILKPGRYPAFYLAAGARDELVPAWHSMKFVAKLRSAKLDSSPVMLNLIPDADHSGPSNTARYREELAKAYAFILNSLGLS